MSEDGREVARRRRAAAVYPFNIAEYEAVCPNGHPVELSTGYSVSAPSWWHQWGTCQICRRGVERTVGVIFRGEDAPCGRFVAGPIHWAGEKIKEEEDWSHDVLNAHRCERCHLLAKKELARTLRDELRALKEEVAGDIQPVDVALVFLKKLEELAV